MLKNRLIVIVLAAITVGVISFSNAAETALAPQTSSAQGIKIIVTPQNLTEKSQPWDFAVKLETHTHPLNDDLAKVSVLIVDGKQHPPLAWEGAPPGGHHRQGTLRFNAINPPPVAVELQIRLSGDVTLRSFSWLLNGAEKGK